jgi:hypothetical protein
MPTFGFSAYLKLVSLNERPRGTAIRGRVAGGGGGYDFHRSMKRAASQLLIGGASLEDLTESLGVIKRAPERLSATMALKRLAEWRSDNPGALATYQAMTYSHPSGLFKVTFTPDFGVRLGRLGTAIHIWNTAQPALKARTVYAALALFPDLYEADVPDDFAVLSLREPQLFRLSEAGRYASLSAGVADNVAEGFRKAFDDLGVPAPPSSRASRLADKFSMAQRRVVGHHACESASSIMRNTGSDTRALRVRGIDPLASMKLHCSREGRPCDPDQQRPRPCQMGLDFRVLRGSSMLPRPLLLKGWISREEQFLVSVFAGLRGGGDCRPQQPPVGPSSP